MVGRRRAVTAFRPSAPAEPGDTPSRTQAVALLLGLVLVAAAVTVASFAVKPARARAFNLFYGSVYVDDNVTPVAVDLASGKPTIRLSSASPAVGAKTTADLDVVPLPGGDTLMLNPTTGEFNMVDQTGFVVKSTGGGVTLPQASPATAVPAQNSAYLLQSTPAGTSVYLVGESTVASGLGAGSSAKPRAFARLEAPVADLRSPSASANGDLWTLTGAGDAHTITQLRVPAGSNAGVALRQTEHGAVTGPAALASATRDSDGSGGDVTAVATTSEIRIFDGAKTQTLSVGGERGADAVVAATNEQGRFDFLYHGTSGWSRVSVAADGSNSPVRQRLDGIDADAPLVTPAMSNGRLYTMEVSGAGRLWQLDADGKLQPVAGTQGYPIVKGEQVELGSSEVIARGNRVIFNARANLQAVVAFSDDSHATRIIDKHSAVQVDPSGATALTQGHDTGPSKQQPTKRATKPQPAQAVNNKIDCKTTSQVPRIPSLQVVQRAARSVQLAWTYPRLDVQDCYPSTYVVSVKLLSSNAPKPPGHVTVQGQTGVLISGLFPASQYEMTVTAYINTKGTTSGPVRVTTGPEGPAAPTDVRAVADNAGNWTVSWSSCGGISQGCVPTQSWSVIPKFCDGRGLSAPPSQLTVPGDPTQHSFSAVYKGGDALLGRSLCFQVQGTSPLGTVGTASRPTAGVLSWSPPIAGALSVNASQPARTSLGGTTTTSVDIDLGSDPTRDVGGVGARITFNLKGPGGTKTRSVTYTGSSSQLSATFDGVQAGAVYTASATVAPPGHPGSAVTTAAKNVTTRADWPALHVSADCPVGQGFVVSCTFSLHLSGLSSAQANGERFSMTDASGVDCGGSSGFQFDQHDFDPAQLSYTREVSLFDYAGTCDVNVALVEAGGSGGSPLVFGGTTSPTAHTTVKFGNASALNAGADDFAATWSSSGGATLAYTSNQYTDSQLDQLSYGWDIHLIAPGGADCGETGSTPTHGGILVPYNATDCLDQYGGKDGWSVQLSYTEKANGHRQGPIQVPIHGTPPGYVPPCELSANNFTAAWAGTADSPAVDVNYSAGGDLTGCSQISFQLVEEKGLLGGGDTNCGDPVGATNPPPAQTTLDATSCKGDIGGPGAPGWHVTVSYHSQRDGDRNFPVAVTGTPPQ